MDLRDGLKKMNVNVDITLRRFSNNEALYKRFLGNFKNDPTFAKLSQAVEKEDYKEIENSAHTLKGVAANMGFEVLSGLCNELVEDVRSERFKDIGNHFDTAKEEYQKLVEEIKFIDS